MKRVFFLTPIALAAGALFACSSAHEPRVDEIAQAASAAGRYTYAFDPSGLSTSVGDGTTTATIARSGSTLTAGSDRYTFDALGRVAAIDDMAFAYGADGHVARATRGASTVAYLYDESGQRIAKTKNGSAVEAYVDGRTVTTTELDEPVRVAGKLVGVLRNARFALAATDVRGTVEADTNGTARLASPFGARPVHPDIANVADYTEKGFDADFAATRMGVRDYDARIGRFLQPDPLYLEHPEKCVASPYDCSLYAYARANPLAFVDPNGTDPRAVTLGVNLTFLAGNIGESIGGGIEVGLILSWHHIPVPYVSIGETHNSDDVIGVSGGPGIGVSVYHDEANVRGESLVTSVSGGPGSGGWVSDTSGTPTGLSVGRGGMGASVSRFTWTTYAAWGNTPSAPAAPAPKATTPAAAAPTILRAPLASPKAGMTPASPFIPLPSQTSATTPSTAPATIDFSWSAIEARHEQMQSQGAQP